MVDFLGIPKKLCRIFRSSAAPAKNDSTTPEQLEAWAKAQEIRRIEKNAVRKSPLLRTIRWAFKTVATIYAAAITTSAATQYFPRIMGPTFDEYMKEQGYSGTLGEKYYDNPNIRVYTNRSLIPFQMGAFVVKNRMNALTGERQTRTGFALGLLEIPFLYTTALYNNFLQSATASSPYAINAANIPGVEDQGAFIYPPQKGFNLPLFTEQIVPDAACAPHLDFATKPDELNKLFIKFTMLHEARHCDQNRVMETDADEYALRVLKKEGTPPVALEELSLYVRSLRSMAAILGTDDIHSTTALSSDKRRNLMQAIEDPAGFAQARAMLKNTVYYNSDILEGLNTTSAYYYSAFRLIQNRQVQMNAPVCRALMSYIMASTYMNDWSEGKLIQKNEFNPALMDLGFLYAPENLTTDKIERAAVRTQPEFRPLPPPATTQSPAIPQSLSSPR